MKDKLRELAEMVREAYRAGFIAACKWPAPVSQDVDSSAYNKEFNDWSFSIREKHAAILDAEGDGGAVGEDAVAEVYEYPRDHREPILTMLTGIRFTGMPLPIGTKLYAAPPASPARVPDNCLPFTNEVIDKMQAVMADHGFVVPVRVISGAFNTTRVALRLAAPSATPEGAGGEGWRIDTDDDVERIAKIAGWDNRRYMTQADYAVWCERMREFVKLASTAPSDGGNEVKDSALLDWLEEQARNSQTGISFDYCKYTEDGHVIEKGYRFMRRHFLGERKPTLRDAIVAAQQPTQRAEGEE